MASEERPESPLRRLSREDAGPWPTEDERIPEWVLAEENNLTEQAETDGLISPQLSKEMDQALRIAVEAEKKILRLPKGVLKALRERRY